MDFYPSGLPFFAFGWRFSTVPPGPGDTIYLQPIVKSLIKPYNRAVAAFFNEYTDSTFATEYMDSGYGYDIDFGGEKARKSDPPRARCESLYDNVSATI